MCQQSFWERKKAVNTCKHTGKNKHAIPLGSLSVSVCLLHEHVLFSHITKPSLKNICLASNWQHTRTVALCGSRWTLVRELPTQNGSRRDKFSQSGQDDWVHVCIMKLEEWQWCFLLLATVTNTFSKNRATQLIRFWRCFRTWDFCHYIVVILLLAKTVVLLWSAGAEILLLLLLFSLYPSVYIYHFPLHSSSCTTLLFCPCLKCVYGGVVVVLASGPVL